MSDIKIEWDTDLMEGDFVEGNGDLKHEDGLETAVIISLFTDGRAKEDDDLPDPTNTDRRGWWGDQAVPDVEEDQIGSRLWLLCRSKTIEEALIDAKLYAEEALEWMIEDNVAASIEIITKRVEKSAALQILGIEVKIRRSDGTVFAKDYEVEWGNQTG